MNCNRALLPERLNAVLPEGRVVCGSDWAKISSLGIGGPLDVIVEPRTTEELSAVLKFCNDNKLHPIILGGGTNVVGASPTNDLVIRIARAQLLDFSFDYGTGLIHVGAGLRLRTFAEKAAKIGYGGLAKLAGIPGSVGGAIVMNASAHQCAISDYLHSVEVMGVDGQCVTISANDLTKGYRDGGIPKDRVVTGAFFELPQVDPEEELEAVKESIRYRLIREPKARSAGCVFRNALDGKVSAGRLIDEAGLKGLRIGGASVAQEHANYLVNDANATASDFAQLVDEVARRVYQHSGLRLQTEIRWINQENPMRKELKQLRVAVLKGGSSSEREVSLKSGACTASALREAGFDVAEIDLTTCEITPEIRGCDLVFSVLHGGFGENGELQALLAKEGIPFVGCEAEACRLVMDKVATKKVMDQHGIPNAPWVLIGKDDARDFPAGFNLPVVVKPPTEGSSVGVTIVKTMDAWLSALELAFKYSDTALVETFIKGAEVAVSVIDGKALPLIELRFKGEFYDYDAKYTYKNGVTEYLCPPPDIPEDIQKKTQEFAEKFCVVTGIRDLVRVDFIVTPDGIPYFIEGNTAPGFTDTSLVPKAAKKIGVSFPELCAKLVAAAAVRAGLI